LVRAWYLHVLWDGRRCECGRRRDQLTEMFVPSAFVIFSASFGIETALREHAPSDSSP
jgi:hypothetical protein